MSHVELIVDLTEQTIDLGLVEEPGLIVVASGNIGPQGPPGPQGEWVSLTQAEYDALSPPDPNTLYVIVS